MKRATLFGLSFFGLSFFGLSSAAFAVGDAAQGEASSMACAACHGADGNSVSGAFPKLAGQNQRYLVKQLMDIQSGARSVPQMAGQLDGMSAADLENLAAFYESKTVTIGQAKAELVALGERIYRAGDSAKGIPACTACHSPTGQGNGPAGFPALGGQHADYVAAQLAAFRIAADQPEKGRTNDGDTRMMRDIAARLSDLEIEALSSYVSGLHP
jgi:cytochrome c553